MPTGFCGNLAAAFGTAITSVLHHNADKMMLRRLVLALSTFGAVALRADVRLPTTASKCVRCAAASSRRRGSTVLYTATVPSGVDVGENDEKIYSAASAAPSGLFGARRDNYLALEIPVVDDLAPTKEELRDQVTADDEEPEGSSFGLDLEMRRPGGFAPVVDASGKTQSKDWLHCLSTWPQSYVLRRISNPLASIVVWSSLVAAWYAVFNPVAKPLGTGMHTLVGGALSLLLVFRTNTACVGRVGATGRARVVASMASGDSLVHTGTTASGTAEVYSVR